MCQQHEETLIAVTNLSLDVKDIRKGQIEMGGRIEVLEVAVLGNGHPPLEETVNELSIIVWGDEKLGVDSLQKMMKKWDVRQKKLAWMVGGGLLLLQGIAVFMQYAGYLIQP